MRIRLSIATAIVAVAAFGVTTAACGGSSGSSASTTAPSADVSPAGDIPDTQAFVAFTPANGGYTIKVPEGWARSDLPTGALFTDKLDSIDVTSAPAPSPPTPASVQASDVPILRSSLHGFVLGTIGSTPRTAGPALRLGYRAESPPDAVTGKAVTQDIERYQFWRNGTVVTITLTSPHGADNVDPWKTVTNSFAWAS